MPLTRSRLDWLRYLVWGGIGLGLAVVLAWPALQIILAASADDDFIVRREMHERFEGVNSAILALFLYVWVFFFGATIGSFLNVVIWRMPRGETVVTRPSRCPWCSTKIKASDNVPVLGWLLLAGKCRTCRLPISPRYPIVEGVMGTIFLLLYQVELLSGGGNLPGHTAQSPRHGLTMLEVDLPLVGIFAFHCFLFCLLLCWGLIAWDRQRQPHPLAVLGFGVGFFAPLVWPHLYPVRWSAWQFEQLADSQRVSVFLTALLGSGVGGLGGEIVRRILPPAADDASHRGGIPLMLAAVGLFLGWQAALVVGALALVLAVVLWPLLRGQRGADYAGGVELSIFGGALGGLLTWAWWADFWGLPLGAAVVVLGLVSLGGAFLLRQLIWRPQIDLGRFRPPAEAELPIAPHIAPSPAGPENKE